MFWLFIAGLGLIGCDYITKAEFEAHWDADEDGWPKGQDCNDGNPRIYPFAPDVRGDGCNSDCGGAIDQDGDDWPDVVDCGPEDPERYPCSLKEVAGDDIDHDCDGSDDIRGDVCNGWDPNYEVDEQIQFGDQCPCVADDDSCNTVGD